MNRKSAHKIIGAKVMQAVHFAVYSKCCNVGTMDFRGVVNGTIRFQVREQVFKSMGSKGESTGFN